MRDNGEAPDVLEGIVRFWDASEAETHAVVERESVAVWYNVSVFTNHS